MALAVKASHYAQAHSLLESLASYEETRSEKRMHDSQQRLLIHLARLYLLIYDSCPSLVTTTTRNEHHRKMNPLTAWLHLCTLNRNEANCVELTKYAPSSNHHLTHTHFLHIHALVPSITLRPMSKSQSTIQNLHSKLAAQRKLEIHQDLLPNNCCWHWQRRMLHLLQDPRKWQTT